MTVTDCGILRIGSARFCAVMMIVSWSASVALCFGSAGGCCACASAGEAAANANKAAEDKKAPRAVRLILFIIFPSERFHAPKRRWRRRRGGNFLLIPGRWFPPESRA